MLYIYIYIYVYIYIQRFRSPRSQKPESRVPESRPDRMARHLAEVQERQGSDPSFRIHMAVSTLFVTTARAETLNGTIWGVKKVIPKIVLFCKKKLT